MGVTLADLDRWDPASVRSVSDAAARRAGETRTVAHDINGIMQQLQWQGESYQSALVKAKAISNELLIHADECDQASRAVGAAASEVEAINSECGNCGSVAGGIFWAFAAFVIMTSDGSATAVTAVSVAGIAAIAAGALA